MRRCLRSWTPARRIRFRHRFGASPRVVHVYTYTMLLRAQLMITYRQHAFLKDESARTGLSMCELVRRAIDATYRPYVRPRVSGYEFGVGLWRRPDAAIVGRRRLVI